MRTPSMVTVQSDDVLCDVTASPACIEPGMLSVTAEPARGVQVPPVMEALPVCDGPPMSSQVHAVGQLAGGGPPDGTTCTWSKAALLDQCVAWESEKRPIVTGPLIDTVVEPMCAQSIPSVEY